MTPKPRFTVVVNLRSEDRHVLDALLSIAQTEGCNLTAVCRQALAEFVRREAMDNGKSQKLDGFLTGPGLTDTMYHHLLTPTELKGWSEEELVRTAKLVRGRKEELDAEIRRRGRYFRW